MFHISAHLLTPFVRNLIFLRRLFLCCTPFPSPCCSALVCVNISEVQEVKTRIVLTYSLPNVGPEADPGVQAVSPQVTF